MIQWSEVEQVKIGNVEWSRTQKDTICISDVSENEDLQVVYMSKYTNLPERYLTLLMEKVSQNVPIGGFQLEEALGEWGDDVTIEESGNYVYILFCGNYLLASIEKHHLRANWMAHLWKELATEQV